MIKDAKSGKKSESPAKNILLFGGGPCHKFKKCCPVLKSYLAKIPGFKTDYVAEDYDVFNAERIKKYDLVVMYNTCAELTIQQKRGLVEWIASGKGFVGIHAAADSFSKSPEYKAMVGGFLRVHTCPREYIVSLTDNKHPACKHLKGYTVKYWEKWPVYEYKVADEQYLLDYDNRAMVLATTVFRNILWPVCWVKTWGEGKVFYLALGHDVKACKNPFFKDFFTGGAEWAVDPAPDKVEPDNRFAIS